MRLQHRLARQERARATRPAGGVGTSTALLASGQALLTGHTTHTGLVWGRTTALGGDGRGRRGNRRRRRGRTKRLCARDERLSEVELDELGDVLEVLAHRGGGSRGDDAGEDVWEG